MLPFVLEISLHLYGVRISARDALDWTVSCSERFSGLHRYPRFAFCMRMRRF